MSGRKKTFTLGIALAIAVLAAFVGSFMLLTVPLLVISALIFAWGLEPKRTEEFAGRVPYGSYVLKALSKLDSMLPGEN
jgi:hypothetical protein